jgi:hypothetical protein
VRVTPAGINAVPGRLVRAVTGQRPAAASEYCGTCAVSSPPAPEVSDMAKKKKKKKKDKQKQHDGEVQAPPAVA